MPGKTVEVVGLESWTISQLADSLRGYGAGFELDAHACAAVLRARFKFADAAVVTFSRAGDTTDYVAISVVEPADSGRVRRRVMGRDTLGFPHGWGEAGTLLRRNPGAAWALANEFPLTAGLTAQDSAASRVIQAFLNNRRTPAEYDAATHALDSHPNVSVRLLAAAVLREAPVDEAFFYALVRAMRDEVDLVAAVPASAIPRMARELRGLDWGPIADDVHAIFDGTNLFVLDATMNAVVESGTDGRWAAPFLANGGHAVLARMRAEDPRMWRGAHALLVALRGEDLGRDSDAWARWVESLGR